jgi:sugar lactone lactonase YvrE
MNTKLYFIAFTMLFFSCTKLETNNSIPDEINIQNSTNSVVSISTNSVINTLCGGTLTGYSGDGGLVENALFNGISGSASDNNNNLYVCDNANFAIRKINLITKTVTTIAGGNGQGSSGDGGLAINAQLDKPNNVAVDKKGNLFISDWGTPNSIRKVDAITGVITKVAGNGWGYNGEGKAPLETNLSGPFAIAFDKNNNLLISTDYGRRLRRLDFKTNTIRTIAGNGLTAYSGDGGLAINSSFNFIWKFAVDKITNDIYISDVHNHVVRKINSRTGIINTFAGNYNYPYGTFIPGVLALNAPLNLVSGIAVDANGNVFVSDESASVVYRINKSNNKISLIAGKHYNNGFSGDGGLSVNSQLFFINSLSIDNKGRLFVSDAGNNRIRVITNKTSQL